MRYVGREEEDESVDVPISIKPEIKEHVYTI